jgi:hypothetical protein
MIINPGDIPSMSATTTAKPKFWPGYKTGPGYCISACVHCGTDMSRIRTGIAYIEIENRTHVICLSCVADFGEIKLADMGDADD